MPEKISSIERVLGKDESVKTELFETMKETFDIHKSRESIHHEIPKTQEDLDVINLANEATNALRLKLGFSKLDVPPDNIYIIDEPHWDYGDGGANARFSVSEQDIETPYHGANLNFARLMFHEMLHCKSFGSMTIVEGKKILLDRFGLSARSINEGKIKTYFNLLNEAVTEEATKQFIIEQIKTRNPLFADDINQLEKRGIDTDNLEQENRGIILGYGEHRQILNMLIDKIFERNPDKFSNRQEVFDIFTKTLFSNNLLAVGKLIDKTFGKGTFRRLGELDSEPEELLKFVESL